MHLTLNLITCGVPFTQAPTDRVPWSLKWVDFEEGRFRSAPPAPPADAAATPQALGPEDGRSVRLRPNAPPPQRMQRLAATPKARAVALERGGCSNFIGPDKQVVRVRDRSRSRRRREGEKQRRKSNKQLRSPKTACVSSPAPPVQPGPPPVRKRDWGLMQVDVVGRNRPPFARTLLCHGVIQVSTSATQCRFFFCFLLHSVLRLFLGAFLSSSALLMCLGRLPM